LAAMRLPFVLLLGLGFIGCGTSNDDPLPDPDAGFPDSGPSDSSVADLGPTDTGVVETCDLLVHVPTLAVGATHTATLGGNFVDGQILGTPEGWRAAFVNPRTIEIKAPYVAGPAAGPLVISFPCGDRIEQREVPLAARALAFTPLARWTPGDTGPLAREYFSMWVDPIAPDRLWLYGGFHYVPRQFTTGHDVWSLNLVNETWTAHDEGPQRGLPGAGLARLPDGRAYRYGGLNFNAIPNERDTPFVIHRIETSTAGLRFTEATVQGPSYGDYHPSFFHHPRTNKLYAVCGLNDQVGAHCDVSAYDPEAETFSPVTVTGPAPIGRNGHFWPTTNTPIG
jgi:hypothetical protein